MMTALISRFSRFSRSTRLHLWGLFLLAVLACSWTLRYSFATKYEQAGPVTALAVIRLEGSEDRAARVLFASQDRLQSAAWSPVDGDAASNPEGTPLQVELELPRLKNISHIHHLLVDPRHPAGLGVVVVGGMPQALGELAWLNLEDRSCYKRISIGEDVLYDACWLPTVRNPDPPGDAMHGQMLAVAGPGADVTLVDTASDELRVLSGHSRTVLCVESVRAARPLLLTAGRDATIRVWDADSLQLVRTLNNHTDAVVDLATRPGELDSPLPMVASAGMDRTIRFWQPTIGRLVRFARLDSQPLAIAWTADGKTLWVSCVDGSLRGIDAESIAVRVIPTKIPRWAYSLQLHGTGLDATEQWAFVGGPHGEVDVVRLP